MALSIILYISSILAAIASSCGLVKFASLGGIYGLALGLYHLPIVFMMTSSLHGASWAYKYDSVERISKRMMICFFIIEIYLSIIACRLLVEYSPLLFSFLKPILFLFQQSRDTIVQQFNNTNGSILFAFS